MHRLITITVAAALFIGGFSFGHWGVRDAALAQKVISLPTEKLKEFAEAFSLVKTHYVDEITDEDLMNLAIRGMMSGLDPHSAYFTAKELNAFQTSVSGVQYGGVGIYLGQKNELLEIIAPIDNTPAMRAGLQAGDLILKIDGVLTKKMPVDKAVDMMRGKVGDVLTLEILTPGQPPRKEELVREQITAPSVMASLAEKDYGFIRITHFRQQTSAEMVSAINRLYEENKEPLKGLVLDLRNNPGGLLDASIAVASVFLPEDAKVVSDEGRQATKTFTAKKSLHHGLVPTDEVKSVRMVVLVNSGSASASEIIAGALQDNRRAVIMGARTYGKASVQSLINLRSTQGKTGIKMTMARYFTPSGRSIQARGIEPDIIVAAGKSVSNDEGFTLRESDNAGHLKNEQAAAKQEEGEESKVAPFVPRDDYQYDQAMTVLKALSVADKST